MKQTIKVAIWTHSGDIHSMWIVTCSTWAKFKNWEKNIVESINHRAVINGYAQDNGSYCYDVLYDVPTEWKKFIDINSDEVDDISTLNVKAYAMIPWFTVKENDAGVLEMGTG